MPIPASKIGEIIRQRRSVLNLGQDQLSQISGVNKKTIQLIENGKGNPSLNTLLQIADALGLSLELVIKTNLPNQESKS